jgi:hypothetical protein
MSQPVSIQGAAALAHWGVIRARGEDAATFLHSQLTSDFAGLDGEAARLAGYCSAKGRLLATFVAWRAAPDEILLACHASVLPATLKRLSMFVLRARCKLTDATADVPLAGLAGEAARRYVDGLPVWSRRDVDGGHVVRLPDATGVARALLAGHAQPPAPALPLDAWRWLEVQSGVPTVEAATVEQFVPQMLNFELVGGVDFAKGCYPGQEVVARTQYRGAIKRRMFLFDVDAPARAGEEIFHEADPAQPAGLVAGAAPRPNAPGSSLLAEVKLAAVGAGALHLGAPDGPALRPRPLPYAVPSDADQAA